MELTKVNARRIQGSLPAMVLLAVLLAACSPARAPQTGDTPGTAELEGKIIIFHAGSLTVPVDALTEAFQAQHPRVGFETEASGSNAAARKISELGGEADLMVSSDYTVIEELLIPDFADWNIRFARNTMVIAYTDQSLYADEVNADNWYDVLTREGVIVGRGDEDVDPCGYRTLLVWQLAEKYYGLSGLYSSLDAACLPANVRPKSEDLLALLQSGDMDYAWEYRSVAVQHGLEFVELPDEINLSQVEHADFYAQATVEIAGEEPGAPMTMTGKPITYGVTIPEVASRPDLALEFVKFLIGAEGQAIIKQHGQPPIVPAVASDKASLPRELISLVE
jgi:molybdate/tungstate transport system substrate-binding protein